LSRLLSECGAHPVELPAIGIQAIQDTAALDEAISNIGDYGWIVFTSVNGVEAYFQRLYELKLDSRALGGLKVAVIGPATARAVEKQGIIPDYVAEVYTSEGLVAGLKSRDIAGQRFLLPRADIADEELAEGLKRLGAEVHEVAVYRTVRAATAISRAKEMLISGQIDVVTFTSSSTVSNLVAAFDGEQPRIDNARVACIGPKTADTAARAGLKVDIIAGEHTVPGLVAAIEDYFRKET